MNLTSTHPQTCFREMTEADIPLGLALCRACRWNQLAADWALFLCLSPHGCRVAEAGGRGAGTVTTLRFGDRFGWISMLLVDPAERGKGIGTALLHQGLEILGDMASVRLDATPAGRPIYARYGFVEEYGIARMENRAVQALAPLSAAVRPMRRADLPGVLALDRDVFGADRRVILEFLFETAPEYAWVAEDDGAIAGFTFGRHGFAFEHLGPVVAGSEWTARALASACLSAHAGQSFIIDVPRFSQSWLDWLERAGFREQRPFIRMCRGAMPSPPGARSQYAIAGPELG